MKTIQLTNMHLENFKMHKSLRVEFGAATVISAANKRGKSTLADAFQWCLFGKDTQGRKDHNITPIVEGETQNRLDAEVCATMLVNGQEVALTRILRPKWTRKRGDKAETFTGYETKYTINGVPKKANEYAAFVAGIIDESVFKLITNPLAFFGLSWQQQREFLFQIAGTVSDSDIAAQKPEFAKLLELLDGKELSDYLKEIAARKKELTTKLSEMQPRIDQTEKNKPEARDWAEIETEIADAQKQISEIEATQADRTKAMQAEYDRIKEVPGRNHSRAFAAHPKGRKGK